MKTPAMKNKTLGLHSSKQSNQNITVIKSNIILLNTLLIKDGNDKMGDHKDDEKELDKNVPIASLTLGKAIYIKLPVHLGGNSTKHCKGTLFQGCRNRWGPTTF